MATYGSYGNRPIDYFGGQMIDPNFVIERFKQLLHGFIPSDVPVPNKKPLKKQVMSKPPNGDPIELQSGTGNLKKGDIFLILKRKGYSNDEIEAFWKKSSNGKKAQIRESEDTDRNIEKVIHKYKAIMGEIKEEKEMADDLEKKERRIDEDIEIYDDLMAQMKRINAPTAERTYREKKKGVEKIKKKFEEEEKKSFEEAKKEFERDVKTEEEVEATSAYSVIQSKAKRLADVLKSKYNFKKTTKLPKGLETEFMSAYPFQEEDIIAKYQNELDAIKVKNDSDDALGKQKASLEAADVQEKLAKLTASKIRLQKRVKTIANAAVAPPEIIEKFKRNPRGKVKLNPKKGRGKSQKIQDIETIKIAIPDK
jgi:hypothetical protein